MNKFANVFKSVGKFMSDHSQEILVGLGISGMISATAVAIVESPKAAKKIEKRKEELDVDKLGFKETLKLVWPNYLPVVGITTVSTACIIGASAKSIKRNTALATAYNLSDTAFRAYRDKVIDTIGEKKEKEIRDRVNGEVLSKHPMNSTQVIVTDNGKQLFYDSLSGRYFTSDMNTIKKIVNDLNRTMRDSGYISLNDFYSEIGLEQTKLGDELGWSIEKANIDIYFSSKLTSDDKACIVLDYVESPFPDYDRYC